MTSFLEAAASAAAAAFTEKAGRKESADVGATVTSQAKSEIKVTLSLQRRCRALNKITVVSTKCQTVSNSCISSETTGGRDGRRW